MNAVVPQTSQTSPKEFQLYRPCYLADSTPQRFLVSILLLLNSFCVAKNWASTCDTKTSSLVFWEKSDSKTLIISAEGNISLTWSLRVKQTSDLSFSFWYNLVHNDMVTHSYLIFIVMAGAVTANNAPAQQGFAALQPSSRQPKHNFSIHANLTLFFNWPLHNLAAFVEWTGNIINLSGF